MTEGTARVWLVDDDVSLASMLKDFLELQEFRVEMMHSGSELLERSRRDLPDLIVLDVMLPDISGFELLEQLRQQHDLPVIMLTARGGESERILGLFGGADDYVAKPCNPLELTARIRAVLKRSRPAERGDSTLLKLGPLQIDPARREVRANQELLSLTAGEMRVLEQLMRRPGEVMTRGELTRLALDRPLEAYDRSIDTLISKLRRKLAAAGIPRSCLRGVRGHGYVLDNTALDSQA
jgi:two-component system response regulator CpxR